MQYELYIDLLYLVNFMMDYLILLLVKKIMGCSTTHLRIFLASSVGALLTCIVIILPIPNSYLEFFIFHFVINVLMLRIGFVLKEKRQFIKCWITLYLSSVLLGGVFQWFKQYLQLTSLFFLMAVISFGMVNVMWWFVANIITDKEKWYEVEIYVNQRSVVVKALLDTGNSLCDPYTGKPVNILEKELLNPILEIGNKGNESEMLQKFKGRYITFHSLGNTGTMLAICVEKMHICGTRDCWVEKPLIALSEETVSVNGDYGMILNPGIL